MQKKTLKSASKSTNKNCGQNFNTNPASTPTNNSCEDVMMDQSDSNTRSGSSKSSNDNDVYALAREDKDKPDIIDARYFKSFEQVFAGFLFLLQFLFKLEIRKQQKAFKVIVQTLNAWYNMYPDWLYKSCYIVYKTDCNCGQYHNQCEICLEEKCTLKHKCWFKFYQILPNDKRNFGELEMVKYLFAKNHITKPQYDKFLHMYKNSQNCLPCFKSFIEIPIKKLCCYQKALLTTMKKTIQKSANILSIIDEKAIQAQSSIAKLLSQTRDVAVLSPNTRDANYNRLKNSSNYLKWIFINGASNNIKSHKLIEDLNLGIVYNNHSRRLEFDITNIGIIIQSNEKINYDSVINKLDLITHSSSIIEATEEELNDCYILAKQYPYIPGKIRKRKRDVAISESLLPSKISKTEDTTKSKILKMQKASISANVKQVQKSTYIVEDSVRETNNFEKRSNPNNILKKVDMIKTKPCI